MNRDEKILKRLGYIEDETNVALHLAEYLKIEINADDFKTLEPLKIVRNKVLHQFLRAYFGMSDIECDKVWNVYKTLRHKSYKSITECIDILKSDLNFSNDRFKANLYLLYGDPTNIKRLLEIKSLCGMDIKEVLTKRPKLIMSNYTSLLKIQDHLRAFNIPDSSAELCLEVFTLGPDTILERLMDLRRVKEFDVLAGHPRILRLVLYQLKARARLEYLKQLKLKCASLHVLSSHSDVFEK